MDEVYDVIVDKVIPEGKHGPYAVATSKSLGKSITFSLIPPVWNENRWPELGTYIVLTKLTKKRAGWRAENGRFLRLSDEKKGE